MSISDDRLDKALHYLATTDESCAEAKANMERMEFAAKSMKATTFLHLEGTVAEREAAAVTSDEVQEAYRRYFDAIKAYNAIANKRATEVLVTDVWRSINANRRSGQV